MFDTVLSQLPRVEPPVWMACDRRRRPRWPAKAQGDALWRELEAVLDNDLPSQRLNRRIRDAERALRRTATAETWKRYLAVEELRVERALRWAEVVARWAHAEGRRGR